MAASPNASHSLLSGMDMDSGGIDQEEGGYIGTSGRGNFGAPPSGNAPPGPGYIHPGTSYAPVHPTLHPTPSLRHTVASAARDGTAFASSAVAGLRRLPRWVLVTAAAVSLTVLGHRAGLFPRAERSRGSTDYPQQNTGQRPLFRPRKGESSRYNDAALGASFCSKVGDYYFGDTLFVYGGHTYQLVGSPGASLSFFDALQLARMRCIGGYPGYLAAIDSEAENSFLAEMLLSKTRLAAADAWIGGNDMTSKGVYQWLSSASRMDGKVFWNKNSQMQGPRPNVYHNFAEGEPKTGGTGGVAEKHCLFLHGQGTNRGPWWSESCYRSLQYAIIEFNGVKKTPKKKKKQNQQ
mmetsp:Transcript_36042/g.70918  ORF Transcript_36042/g.70918 Transcript_36042/m.70918 type:complete len:350 (+) Transcript_36042:91-1140(+)|eukprot:CAMPEP_0194314758 /NCGR_PEP_ID=MMETSP0171-20130528/11597_1 /TAXON_ID=218684 /ORGANISM="Corethron pennatum, Strain L29A3" /LENGTH=349 /DNA_ID=CAMNT_0039070313 /DNA_START=70 /DNA_END=1119 /DNA_ORIENTATION=-